MRTRTVMTIAAVVAIAAFVAIVLLIAVDRTKALQDRSETQAAIAAALTTARPSAYGEVMDLRSRVCFDFMLRPSANIGLIYRAHEADLDYDYLKTIERNRTLNRLVQLQAYLLTTTKELKPGAFVIPMDGDTTWTEGEGVVVKVTPTNHGQKFTIVFKLKS